MWKYSLGKFVINNKKKSKVICDFYDVTGIYAEKKDLKIVFDEEIVEQDLGARNLFLKMQMVLFTDINKKYF